MNFPPYNYLFLTFIKVHFLLLWGGKVIHIIFFNQEKKSQERTNKGAFHLVIKQLLIALLSNLQKPGRGVGKQ